MSDIASLALDRAALNRLGLSRGREANASAIAATRTTTVAPVA